ncbi:preprotein translocase subunit SecG [Devriesea agamarum]|uniref:preprotein translocase subunit SecG n=1 Tax=Devriesea agamarum TaxID=472569 RepID=UPI00071D9900|nr:preprotein translocase subunit SecG [Devriesea agamarum]
MDILKIALQSVLALTSILLILLVLLHKGKGGGLSDMFGGGISTSAGSSGVAERNLNRITVAIAIIWVLSIAGIGVIDRFAAVAG